MNQAEKISRRAAVSHAVGNPPWADIDKIVDCMRELDRCKCSHDRVDHDPKCVKPGCGCKGFRP